jgi:hypothetical protein
MFSETRPRRFAVKTFLNLAMHTARVHFSLLLLFKFGMTTSVPFFLRETFTANAARPPVETAPATTNPTVAKQNGHIVHLLGGQLER